MKDIRIPVPWGYIAGCWYGNRKVRPILAIHGWLDNLGTWTKLLPLLPKHIGVLCIDLPGHGLSSKFPAGIIYHTLDFLNVILWIMKEYNWEKVTLLGHSLGSIISFLFTSLCPNKVDMLIGIDLVYPRYSRQMTMESRLEEMRLCVEKNLVLSELQSKSNHEEPPSYTYTNLEKMLYEGSGYSLELENCKYILDRSIKKSVKFPEKYFFHRDAKLKYYTKFRENPSFYHEMGKNISNVPFLIIKGRQSDLIDMEEHESLFEFLHGDNKHFEFHQVDGTHHVHLNNASGVAKVLNPFINRYRPDTLTQWTLNDDEGCDTISNTESLLGRKVGKSKL